MNKVSLKKNICLPGRIHFVLLAIALCILLALFFPLSSGDGLFQSRSAFNSIFWIDDLKETPDLLDPQNIVYTSEYYILENLSCGLVRDSKRSASEYEGCLAERFFQPDPKTWIFILRELKWSDGTIVSKSEIEAWINGLKENRSRHIQFLRSATKISFNEHTRELVVNFPFSITPAFLHELSLADAGLMPTDFKNKGWTRTVGPYFVSEWKKKDNLLLLVANKYSPFYRPSMPQKVELRSLRNQSLRPELFKSINVDLVPLDPLTPPEKTRVLLQNKPQVYISYPTYLLYFILNKKNPLANNRGAREEFSRVIATAQDGFSSIEDDSTLKPEMQLIPTGFEGRLPKVEPTKFKSFDILKKKKIKIKMFKNFSNMKNLVDNLKKTFSELNIDLEINVGSTHTFDDSNDFAGVQAFVSNQREPSGSWSFLLFSSQGPIHPWLNDMKAEFKKATDDGLGHYGKEFFLSLHRYVLSEHFVVPYMMGSQRYLLSERVDATEWNRFDSRVRFYELKMR